MNKQKTIYNSNALMDKKYDTVKTFRTIKEKISLEMASMNFYISKFPN
jgi:hypothetical protein